MSSNSAACQQAMKCCGAMVRDEEPTVSIDEMKMSCSGVALAKTDEECDQFKADYVAMIESRQNEAPAVCK